MECKKLQEERNGITLTILQEKGGCGKSCAIFNIAAYLSKKKNVLIIDLDGQAADISYFLFGNKVGDSQDPMRSDVKTIMHIFRGADPKDVIVPVKENLDIVPANTEVTGLLSIHKIKTFKDFINKMRKKYDYILIDVPPSPNWSHVLCLSVCDYVMPIVNPDAASPKAIIGLNDSVEEIQSTSNPSLEYLGIIMNKYNERTNIAKTMLQQTENIAEQLEVSLFDTKIHQSVLLEEHILSHQSIFEYAGKSKSAKEYKNLSEEIISRIAERRR